MSSLSATYTLAAPYRASWSFRAPAVPGAPTTTAAGSPSCLAAVSSSKVAFLTVPSTESTRTRTSAISRIPLSSRPASDELLGGEEVGDLGAAVPFVLHDLAGFARRGVLERLDRAPRVGQADLRGVEPEVGERLDVDRLALRGHDALEGRVPRVVDLLDHADHGRRAGLDLLVA